MAGATHPHSHFHRGERGVCRNYQPPNNRFPCPASQGGYGPSGASLGLAGLDGPGNRPRSIQACGGAGGGPRRTQPNDRSRPKRRTILSPHGRSSEQRDRDRSPRSPPRFAHPDLRPNEKLQPGAWTPGFVRNGTRQGSAPGCKNTPNPCPNRPGRIVHAGPHAHRVRRVRRGDHFARRRASSADLA
jgi:hypothetical protein